MKINSFLNLLGAQINRLVFPATVVCALIILGPVVLAASETGKAFVSPAEAVKALGQAVNSTNYAAFALLFGPNSDRLQNPDSVQGARELAEFTAAFNSFNRLVPESDQKMTLEVGPNSWPFPIPLVKTAQGWCFDATGGYDEILNRRIGRNELEVLRAVRAYVEAQREYATRDRDGDRVLEYAQKLASSPGRTDGLYWPLELNGEISPLGPLFAQAHSEGYFRESSSAVAGAPIEPFHGYFFKILTRQGKGAPGGKYEYIINGNMIGGFALVAWPAEYGESGIMTFIVNQQGTVYQKDLGLTTSKTVKKLNSYDLDSSWKPSPD